MMRLLLLLCSLTAALAGGSLNAMETDAAGVFFQRQAFGVASEAYAHAVLGPDGSEDPEARLGLAESAWRDGRGEAARDAWQAYLLRHVGGPLETRALIGLSAALDSLGDHSGAAKAAQGAETQAPAGEGWHAALLAADALYDGSQFQEAEAAYRRAGERYAGQLDEPAFIPYARAWCLLRWAQLPRRAAGPEDAGADSTNALSQAAELFSQVAGLKGGDRYAPSALYQQAECRYLAGDYEAAAVGYQDFEKRYAMNPLVAAARYSLAWCRFEQGQYKEAATAFHRFSVVHADHPLAPWGLYLAGVSLARGGDLDLAESAYQVCLQQYPGSAVADRCRYGLAWLATSRKDYVAAAAAWATFLKNDGQGPLAASGTFLYADALYQLGRYAAAHEQYLALLSGWPKDPLAEDALYYAANASLALGENGQARDELQQFLRLRPDSSYALEARRRLGDAQYADGHLDAAEQAYHDLRQLAPGTREAAEAGLGLGWVSFSRKDWAAAAARFKSAGGELPVAEAAEAWLRGG
ncbi:MAG TPA: tetratricopeptide repeat protein, partial [bacterium]|nr:tetratricopeptide repeat protein [bacterium]